MSDRKAKKMSESVMEQASHVRSSHLNGTGRLFGGQLMSWIDVAAGITARRHAGAYCITAAIDNLQFKKAVFQNDLVVMRSMVTYVGSTSMEVQVKTYVESLNGERDLVNEAYLVMVALDNEGHPAKVPGIIAETDEEKEILAAAEKRYNLRKQRKEENF